MVGATRQWVSVSLERFRARGLIGPKRRQLVILDMAALRAFADGETEFKAGKR
jgi:hypothetical protein